MLFIKLFHSTTWLSTDVAKNIKIVENHHLNPEIPVKFWLNNQLLSASMLHSWTSLLHHSHIRLKNLSFEKIMQCHKDWDYIQTSRQDLICYLQLDLFSVTDLLWILSGGKGINITEISEEVKILKAFVEELKNGIFIDQLSFIC